MSLDDLRFAIAEILERDCRTTQAEVARMLDCDPDEVARIVREMEDTGIIVRYSAKINWEKLGAGRKVFATIGVQVTPEREVGFDGVAERIIHFPEVHSLYLTSGQQDLNVVIEGADMRDIAYFVAQRLAVIPGVRGTVTQFVLKTYKRDGDVLVDSDDNERLAVTP